MPMSTRKKNALKRKQGRDRVRKHRAKRAKELANLHGDQDTTTEDEGSENEVIVDDSEGEQAEAMQPNELEPELSRCPVVAVQRNIDDAKQPDGDTVQRDEPEPGQSRSLDVASQGAEQMTSNFPDAPTSLAMPRLEPEEELTRSTEEETAERSDEDKKLDRLVTNMSKIMVSHDVSNAAVEDIFRMLCENIDDIQSLLRSGRITSSYMKSIKPKAMKNCPNITCSYLLERAHAGEITKEMTTGLETIPKDILLLSHNSPTRLLRTEASVKLTDIVDHHVKTHKKLGFSPDTLHKQLTSAQISVDGVRESPKGSRTFIITSIRFGSCIYVFNVLNPLLGDPKNYPNVARGSSVSVQRLRHKLPTLNSCSVAFSRDLVMCNDLDTRFLRLIAVPLHFLETWSTKLPSILLLKLGTSSLTKLNAIR